MSDPVGRKKIAEGLANLIRTNYPETTIIAGTATAGIPHAAWVADISRFANGLRSLISKRTWKKSPN